MNKWHGYRCWGLLLVWLITLVPPTLRAAEPVLHIQNDDPGQRALQPYLAVLEDPSLQLGLEQVRQPAQAARFLPAAQKNISMKASPIQPTGCA